MASHSSDGPVNLTTLYNNYDRSMVPDLDPTIARFSALGYPSFKLTPCCCFALPGHLPTAISPLLCTSCNRAVFRLGLYGGIRVPSSRSTIALLAQSWVLPVAESEPCPQHVSCTPRILAAQQSASIKSS
jgi:hypothetical protein